MSVGAENWSDLRTTGTTAFRSGTTTLIKISQEIGKKVSWAGTTAFWAGTTAQVKAAGKQ
jgi:hypothetical protein